MADYIDREELLKELHRRHWEVMVDFIEMEFPVVKERIDDMPSVDAVEVVRCKDCKYNGKPYCDLLTTGSRDWYINDDDFCKWGERRGQYDKGYDDGFNDGRKAVIAEIIEEYGDEVTEDGIQAILQG